MNIKNLVDTTDIQAVMDMIRLHYGDKDIVLFEQLYADLKAMEPNENPDHVTVFIVAVRPGEEEDECLDIFNELDPSIDFDVSAIQAGDDIIYSIASSSYRDYLGYFVDAKTLNTMSAASILAHSLWEITSYSFDDAPL